MQFEESAKDCVLLAIYKFDTNQEHCIRYLHGSKYIWHTPGTTMHINVAMPTHKNDKSDRPYLKLSKVEMKSNSNIYSTKVKLISLNFKQQYVFIGILNNYLYEER